MGRWEEGDGKMPYHKRSYYRKPHELCARSTGIGCLCTAHEDENECPVHKHRKRFPWGTAILIALFFLLILWEILYGGFNPMLFPGACE